MLNFKRLLMVGLLGVLVLAVMPAFAQDDATRDPDALARQLLGYDGSPAFPDLFPVYEVGDTAEFWVSKTGQSTPTRVNATLAASSATLYIFVEDGITYDQEKLAPVSSRLEYNLALLRITANLGGVTVTPQSFEELASLRQLQLPDVDNDPHFYVLFAKDLNTNRPTLFNPNNSLVEALTPGGYSNQHEMVIVNTNSYPGVPLDNATFVNVLTRQFYNMLMFYSNPHQAPWLREALSWYMLLNIQQQALAAGDVAAFLNAPQTSLLSLPALGNNGEQFGVGQLFLRYIIQRFGEDFFRELFLEPGDGLVPLERVLARNRRTDLVTGQPITAADVFADFVMANVINTSIGDGRYFYSIDEALQNQFAAVIPLKDQFNFQLPTLPATPLGTNYIALQTSQAVSFNMQFQGQSQGARLPVPGTLVNHFYWSGEGMNENNTLTRSFDLSGVQSATLNFDAWYNLADRWNYGYVEVSADDGTTWTALPATSSLADNPNALSYGPAFTGISNPEGPRPFPYLGIGLDADGITITNIQPDGPVATTEIQPGDTIAGHDGQQWDTNPNLLAYLAEFKPGDTVNLYMNRGTRFFDVSVVLGKHPTRVVTPDPIWTQQTVDLNAYAGKNIIVRFAYISVADTGDLGMAVDNISIPEINFLDDAESGVQGWTVNGWQQMTNALPQDFLLQYAVLKADGSSGKVVQLIGPNNPSSAGSWDLSLKPDEVMLIAISSLNDNTSLPGIFTLAVQNTTPAAAPTSTPSA